MFRFRNRRRLVALVAGSWLALSGAPPMALAATEDERGIPAEEDPALLEAKRAVRLRDFEAAVEIWRNAANKGIPRAQYRLGAAYRSGRGVARDIDKAAFWFEKAAAGGDADAQYGLGMLYQNGLGVEIDRDLALEFIALAARGGHGEARRTLARIQKPGSLGFETAVARVAVHRKDPREALSQAIRFGDLGAAREALARGAPVDGAPGDRKHWRPLILAIEHERPGQVKLLFEYRADPNQESSMSEPALILAIRKENREIVRQILSAGGVVDARSKSGYTPLMEAARLGQDGIVDDLLASGAHPKTTLSDGTSAADIARRFRFETLSQRLRRAGAPVLADDEGAPVAGRGSSARNRASESQAILPPVVEAARRGDAELLEDLLAGGSKLAIRDPEGDYPSHRAADGGHAAAMRVLLGGGLGPDLRGKNDTTALMRAMGSAARGSDEVVEILLAAGADPQLKDRHAAGVIDYAVTGATKRKMELLAKGGASWPARDARKALEEAARAGRAPAVRGLLTVVPAPADRSATLCGAVAGNRSDVLDLLLGVGLKPSADCGEGRGGPLQIAASAGRDELVKKLLAAGANPDERTKDGDSALIAAASHGHVAIVKRLLAAGADVDGRGAHRMTALLVAASNGHVEVVHALLEAGADRRMRSESDQKAIDLARAAGHSETAKLIEDFKPGWRRWLGSSEAAKQGN